MGQKKSDGACMAEAPWQEYWIPIQYSCQGGGGGAHRTAYDARGGMGGALGVLGVGYAGRSQRCMRRVNRSAARLSRGGIGDLRVECVKEVSGRVSFSI